MKKRVLYVEDEVNLGRIVAETLEQKGFDVKLVQDGARVMESCRSFKPDIGVLDVMLPNVDGFELGREIRSLFPHMPLLFLTARSQTRDVLEGFRSGGTDYMRKPFSMEELVARIHNQLSLVPHPAVHAAEEIVLSRSRFYPSRMELHVSGNTIRLSNRETQVLRLLTEQINKAVDRRFLLLQVWNDDSFFHSRNLDVYIRRLRSYLEADRGIQIITLKGKGYQFVVDTAVRNSPR